MTEPSAWAKHNEQYLAAALGWLRLRLQRQIQRLTQGQTQETRTPEALQAALTQTEQHMAAAAAVDPPPALVMLGQIFNLSDFGRSLLLLCAALELDTHIAALCARAQDDASRPYPTFALALALFDQPLWDVVVAEHPLRYWQLIRVQGAGHQPLTTSPLRADERIVNYIKGLNLLDERLTAFMVPLEGEGAEVPLPPSQQQSVDAIAHHLKTQAYQVPLMQLVGPDPVSQQLIAQQAANRLGLHLYRLPVALLPSPASDLDRLSRLWQRESQLMPILLYLDAHLAEADLGSIASPLHRFLMRHRTPSFLSLRDVHHSLGPSSTVIDIDKPTASEQQQLWTELIGDRAPQSPHLLSQQFNLNLPTIYRIAQTSSLSLPLHPHLWDACLTHTRPQLDQLAQRLTPKATWDDIVLPNDDTALLHQIADQVRQRHTVYQTWGFSRRMNRGLGISALFAGESGTGKTMAAEVIANELQLNLYRIDLSAVVSKYIGETEKNLRRLFDAAEDGGAILFFDEADALFGKRSEVKDSHDRYANIEINYLLQRIEAYSGLAILATNLKQAIDTAFLRRLRFVVNFTFPNSRERQGIWQRAFPPETPMETLDYERLAKFNLTGGNIHNVALNAAFLAAQANTAITMPLVLTAVRTEFKKLDRPISEADFRL
jgi:hypothetical protein